MYDVSAGRSADALRPAGATRSADDLTVVADDLTVVEEAAVARDLAGARPSGLPAVWDYAVPRPVNRARPAYLRRYTAVVAGLDMVAALVAALLADLDTGGTREVLATLLFPVAWFACLTVGRVYELRFVGNGNEEYRRLFDAAVRFLALAATVSYAVRVSSGRELIIFAVPVAIVLSLGVHYAARQWLHRLRRAGRCQQRVVVVGRERSVAELIRSVRREPEAGFAMAAACVDSSRSDVIEGVRVLGDSGSIVEVLEQVKADTVMITAWSDVSQTDLRRLSWDLEGSHVSLLVAPRLTDVAGPRIHVRPVAGLPLLNVEEPEFTGVRRLLKESIDRVGALLALLLLGPLLLTVALAIRLTSSGPVLFRQFRIGQHGAPFVMHKFRSMYVDAEQHQADLAAENDMGDGPLFKMRDDPRITRVGRFIRRFSLDELPQLIDVVRGDMSLVGPRPPLPGEVERYASEVRRRLIVKPGITGLWQVSGRADLAWEEAVRLDLHYVENWSLALDVAIVAKTLLAVLRRQGAY